MSDPLDAAIGPTWAEIDLDALTSNVALVRSLLPSGCRLLAVVKANAYGHGAVESARALVSGGAWGLGVSTVAEGLQLRAAGLNAPILVFTPPRPADLGPAVDAGLALTVVDLEGAQALAASIGPVVAHVKLDTGMGRYGIGWEQLGQLAPVLAELSGRIGWEGVYTHCARGADPRAVRRQLDRLLRAVTAAAEAGLELPLRHAAASAAVLTVPEAHLEMVRVGSLLYGHLPAGIRTDLPFRRAFALHSTVTQVHVVRAGSQVGYGGEWTARADTRVATVPVGFADGLDMLPAGPFRRPAVLVRALGRALARRFHLERVLRLGRAAGDVVVGGVPLPILGRVGMQQVTVDCSRKPDVRPGMRAEVGVPSTAAGAHLARVYLRHGRAVVADTLLGRIEPPARESVSQE